jgi:hypothetical protein
MKLLVISLFSLLVTQSAWALPVLNRNTAGAENLTIFPDHLDPNLYYLAPTVVVVSKQESGIPNFSYMEFRVNGVRHALVQTTLKPDFSYQQIEAAKARIRQINPNAQFTALPFENSAVNFVGSMKPLVARSDCQHTAGTVGDEQTCAFELYRKGITVMLPMFTKGLTITTQFSYEINGVQQNADGSYVNKKNSYQVAGRIGGPELANYPELFLGVDGKPVKTSFWGMDSYTFGTDEVGPQ